MAIAQSVPGARPSTTPDWLAPAIVIFAAFATTAWHGTLPLNHDVAWIWEGANRLLHGAHFGRDIDDVNPPLAWWLTAIPVLLQYGTGLSASVSFSGFIAALSAGSVLISLRAMPEISRRHGLLFAAIAVWALMFAPGYDFGQREHLMVILGLPYLSAAIPRPEPEHRALPPAMRVFIGIAAGVGFCLKPYFLLIPLFVEAWRWGPLRGATFLRIEIITMALVGVAYVLAVLLFAPEYLSVVVPQAAAGYGAYNAPLPRVVFRFLLKLIPVVSGIYIIALANRPCRISSSTTCFIVAGAAAATGCLIQSKGWAYQMYPALAFLFFAVAAQNIAVKSLVTAGGVAIVLMSGSQNAVSQIVDADGTRARVASLSSTFGHDTVFAFTTSPRDVHPAIVESGAIWRAPACCLYLLPGDIEGRSAAAISAGRHQASREISRLSANAPDIVIVNDSFRQLGFGGRHFDYLAHFRNDPQFEKFWRRYREVPRIGNFRIFRCSEECNGKPGRR